MSRVFISGSSTGLGLMAADLLAGKSHSVVLHARNAERAEEARRKLPRAEAIVVGDIETIAGAKDLAARVNALGRFDAVIHNAAVGYREGRSRHRRRPAACVRDQHAIGLYPDGADRAAEAARLPELRHAPSCRRQSRRRSLWKKRRWNGSAAYAESKLHDAMLAFAIARRWPDVFSNALEPGWVPTKMGGAGAPDDMDQAHLTQAWLAAGDDPKADVTGRYFYHLKRMEPNPQSHNVALQDRLIAICAEISGVALPE